MNVAVALAALAGCGAPAPSSPPVTPVVPTAVVPPTPALVRIVNDTDVARSFDITFGAHQPFGITRLDGALDPSAALGPCVCLCGTPCISAARPDDEAVRLEPGATYDYAWDGRVLRSGGDLGPCCELFTTPPGRYAFTACAMDGGCAHVAVTLPASEPVLVPLSAASTVDSCAALALALHQDAVARFVADLAVTLRDRPVSDCPPARCVEPGDLSAALDAARGRSCSVFVVPRGAEVETRAFLPLPSGSAGGESYSRFTDPDFTRVFRVRYEQ